MTQIELAKKADLDAKSDVGHTHAEADVTGLVAHLNAKSDVGHGHTKAEITGLVADLAALLPKAGGTMTGKITLDGDPVNNLHPATKQYVLAQITALVNGAPGTLDTLNEIATQLAADESAATALAGTVAGKLAASANLSDLVSAATARTNLGLGTAATRTVPAAGNAAAGEVVLGADTRLSDARTPTTHTHAEADVTGLVADLAAKVPKSIFDAKGDLIVGSADDTPGRLGAGVNGYVLTADSAQALGVKWAAAAGGATATWVNVKDYTAVGDGSADDTTPIQNAINAASTAGGGGVFFPRGTYKITAAITVPARVTLVGAGREATIIKRSAADFDMFRYWGATSGVNANRCTYAGMRDMTLHGNSRTGRVIDAVYADNLSFRDVFMNANNGPGLDLVEVWDSLFDNVALDAVSSTTEPSIWIRSSRAASGFGSGTDNSNVLRFINCRSESWKAGAVKMERGTGGTQTCNHIWFRNFKAESYFLRGSAIDLGAANAVNLVWFDDIYIHMGGFDTGFSTAKHAIDASGIGISGGFRKIHISNGAAATVDSGIYCWTGAQISFEDIYGQYTTAPVSGNHVNLAGGGPYAIREPIQSSNATRALQMGSSDTVKSLGPGPIMRRDATDISDADWTSINASYVPPHGVQGVRKDRKQLFVKTGDSEWRFADLYQAPKTIASAATIAPGSGVRVCHITGTTTIGTITATYDGHIIVLRFAAACAVTDGTQVKLAGAFTATAGSTLTLLCDGTNWSEVGRAVV